MNNRQKGTQFEQLASDFFLEKGYQILEKNYRTKTGEIDLIVQDSDNTIVFVEVKFRKNEKRGYPFEAVSKTKQQRIYRTAEWYIKEHHLSYLYKYRFDVISILNDQISHYSNAFGSF